MFPRILNLPFSCVIEQDFVELVVFQAQLALSILIDSFSHF